MMKAIESVKQLFRHRALAQVLIARELKARYRGTVFGFLWSLLNPLFLTLTYMLVFSMILPVDMPNFYIFLLAAVLPWTCFASTLNEATVSILRNGGLIRKVPLPSEIFPLVSVGTYTMHCLFGSLVLLAVIMVSGTELSWFVLLFPFILGIQTLFTYGLSLLLASLSVQFRDLQHMTPNLLTIWFFATPIVYPTTLIPEHLRPLLKFNPMAQLTIAYQDIFYYGRAPSVTDLLLVGLISLVLLAFGLSYFDSRREFMAEEV